LDERKRLLVLGYIKPIAVPFENALKTNHWKTGMPGLVPFNGNFLPERKH